MQYSYDIQPDNSTTSMRKTSKTIALFFSTIFIVAGHMSAAVEEEPAEETISDESLRIPGVFSSVLPGTEKKNSLKLILHPHLGDLEKRQFIRTDIGFSYGLNKQWDILAKTRFYFGHGLKDEGLFSKPGLADYELESKYRLGETIFPGWDTALNFAYASPIGLPEPNVTDGLIHRKTTFSFARRLESRPQVRVFWGLTTDIVSQTEVIGRIEKNDIRDSTQKISGGFVAEHGNLFYTFESSYETSRLWGSTRKDLWTVRPGLIWDFSHKHSDAKGKWLIGVGTPVSFGPDGTEIGLRVKLRLNIDFKRLIRGHKSDGH